ncbi:LysR family transcriptional regulator [Patulibacter minatonensis]|uniref:LysR family transcriptional regulator n=1 Tax=Patulibacter minatonensis TaxID=298163 RepID=UPI0004AECC70|nr:LysR substrate-binding domain-containing protein [Patulibacter minatonensis]
MEDVDLDPRLLRTFLAVAETLHFGRAADRLHLAQGSVSGHVRRLEDVLGVELLARTSRSVALTAAGAVLQEHARRLEQATLAAVRETRRADRGQSGSLSVGIAAAIPLELVSPAIAAFREARPDVALELREAPWTDPSGGLADGGVDVAFLRPPVAAAGVALETLVVEDRMAILPADHRLAEREVLSITEFVDEPWAGSDTDPVWRAFWTAEAERGAPARYAATISSFDGLFDAVRHAGAVGLVPASAPARMSGATGVAFVPVRDVAPTTIDVGWHPASEDPRVRAFVALARRMLRRTG